MRDRIRQWWQWMHTVPTGPRTLVATVAWWERRRLSYNAFLAIVGIPSIVLLYAMVDVADALTPGEDSVEPLAFMVAPFLANIAYTAGWIVEGGLLWTRPKLPRGPRLMRFGLVFSLVLILLPVAVWTWRALVPRPSRTRTDTSQPATDDTPSRSEEMFEKVVGQYGWTVPPFGTGSSPGDRSRPQLMLDACRPTPARPCLSRAPCSSTS